MVSRRAISGGARMTQARHKYFLTDAILANLRLLLLSGGSALLYFGSLFTAWFKSAPVWSTSVPIGILVGLFNVLCWSWVKFERDVRKDIGDLRSDVRKDIGDLRSDLSNVAHVVDVTNERGYFINMMAAIKLAKERADLTHLDRTKPSASDLQELKDYFEAANAVVQKRVIRVRRIVRIETPDILEWVIELLEQLGNCPNYSMACLREPADGAISLQIFDAKEMLLVQLDKGDIGSGPQNQMLRIKGEKLAAAFSTYYQKRWEAATLIKDRNSIYWERLTEIAGRLSTRASEEGDESAVRNISVSLARLRELASKDRNKIA
jgi:hypothetical protein